MAHLILIIQEVDKCQTVIGNQYRTLGVSVDVKSTYAGKRMFCVDTRGCLI